MYKALILDDEERPIRVLLHCLKAYPEFKVVATCRDAPSTLSAVKAHRPDILFLDILVDGETIFPLLDELWDGDYAPAIVFVTAWGEKFLREAMERCGQLFQWSYLMKPVRDKKLATVIRRFRAVREQAGSEEKQLLMKAGGREFRLSFKEIVYCESDGNYVKLFQLRGGRLVRHIWSGSLSRLLKEALQDPDFVRISSKRAINRKYLRGSAEQRAKCVLKTKNMLEEVLLPVPENRRKAVWGELLG